MSNLEQLSKLGQAVWFDYIRRSFITSGELQKLVDQGVRGVTSNPAIFEKAIAGSADYDQDLNILVEAGKSVEEIYETLTLEDIRRAADILRPVYDQSNGEDGYISLEVSPTLANDTNGTVAEASRLFNELDRPNIMIKIPATRAGIPAIETAISKGINVNVTLLFSLLHYEGTAQAYIAGLEKYAASGGDVSKIASVASFFVSRVDTAVDRELENLGGSSLQGKIAIANAKIAYARFKEIFSGERWEKLASQGARVQRPLWASTGTKNPGYSDTLYVDNLIGLDTVNTVPPATLQSFLDHGIVSSTLEADIDEARSQLVQLAKLGIDLDAITQKLQDDGVAAFSKSFEVLMASIAGKREKLLAGWGLMSADLFGYKGLVDSALSKMEEDQIMSRIWSIDHTVWKPEPEEITNRLGWLHITEKMLEDLPRLQSLAENVRLEGYTNALLLGMGGSSLAPEVFRNTYGVRKGYLGLTVLDSTDPGAVLNQAEKLNPSKTLFIVSTKSGGTVETLSFFKFFYNRVLEAVGAENAGAHFVAITDPGSHLAELADQYEFRATFLNDPNIGGRYSALSYFGLVPASLIGMDVELLLERASNMVCNCEGCNNPITGDNHGAYLGAILGELAKAGRDKVTLITSPGIRSFGDWVEQLIAESTGKEGKGILPVVGETVGSPGVYGDDRLFVYLKLEGDETFDSTLKVLEDTGNPVVRLNLGDLYDLGEQFFLWEMATAVAGYRLGINPFDQPNVESAKVLARKMLTTYQEKGKLPVSNPVLSADGITVFGDVQANTHESALQSFLSQAQPGAYIALQAFVQPTQETDAALLRLRTSLRDETKMAVTTGYGPRFLHSTGQLHKGDAGRGLFIQFTSDSAQDIPIPDEAGASESSINFGVLEMSAALGDNQALLDAGRKVIRFHLGTDILGGLNLLSETFV
ncbi:MAG TPA: bifunctional transaldolase/phosoglucose isomerase [Anaerolineales bacterium]|nr:bifunctional transaldolase/phosoglucose isomerase [Anaerolineales bacterium]